MTLVDKQQATELNWLILFLMMTLIVRFHGIIMWMQPHNIGLS